MGYVKAQATLRKDRAETVTIKLVGWDPDELDDLVVQFPSSVVRLVGLARLQERQRQSKIRG